MNTPDKFHGNGLFPLISFQQRNSAQFSRRELQLVGPTGNIQLFLKQLLVSVALLVPDLQRDPTFVLGLLESNLGRNLCCMDVFVTYVLGVDFTPPILLSTYYRLKAAAESMRVWERCPLLLARGTCASSEERKGSKLDINHPECQPAEPKSLGKARLFSSSFPKSRGSDPNSDSE